MRGDIFRETNLTREFTWGVAGKLLLYLFFGFLVVRSAAAVWLFDNIAVLLAIAGMKLLMIFDAGIVRSGSELRGTGTGYAISVSEACDGSGLIIVWVSAILGLQAGKFYWGNLIKIFCISFLAVQIFNLFRIIVLYMLLPAQRPGFEIVHLYVFPFLSVALVVGLICLCSNYRHLVSGSLVIRWCVVSTAGAILWYFIQAPVSQALAVSLGNAILSVLPQSVVQSMTATDISAQINTTLVPDPASMKPLILGIYPTDYMLAAPLVVAGLFLTNGRSATMFLVIAGFLISAALALSIAAVTDSHIAAYRDDIKFMANGTGEVFPFVAASPTFIAVMASLQNTIVHFNLFFAPFAVHFFLQAGDPARRRTH